MSVNSAVSDILVIKIHQTQLKLENLDTNTSVYPGDIPTKLIVKCAQYLSVPLFANFKQCFVDGIFPVCFKRAIISPIPKNKTPKVPSDLKPISKIPIFYEILKVLFTISSLTIFNIKVIQISLDLGRIIAPRIA